MTVVFSGRTSHNRNYHHHHHQQQSKQSKQKQQRKSKTKRTTTCTTSTVTGESIKDTNFGTYRISFHDEYRLCKKLNGGKYGSVYSAQHRSSKRMVAVKVIPRYDNLRDNEIIQEALILRNISQQQVQVQGQGQEGVVELIDFYTSNSDRFYIVQNLAMGGDVLDRVCDYGTYNENDACILFYNLLQTIQLLHEQHNITHRDIKPENLLLPKMDDYTTVQLCDFGYATYLPSKSGSSLSRQCGTTEYIAPEVVSGKPYNEQIDMWSIGCTMYVLLCGYQAFEGDNDIETYSNISSCRYDYNDPKWDEISFECKELIDHLLVLDPKQRWTAQQALQCQWFQNNPTIIRKLQQQYQRQQRQTHQQRRSNKENASTTTTMKTMRTNTMKNQSLVKTVPVQENTEEDDEQTTMCTSCELTFLTKLGSYLFPNLKWKKTSPVFVDFVAIDDDDSVVPTTDDEDDDDGDDDSSSIPQQATKEEEEGDDDDDNNKWRSDEMIRTKSLSARTDMTCSSSSADLLSQEVEEDAKFVYEILHTK